MNTKNIKNGVAVEIFDLDINSKNYNSKQIKNLLLQNTIVVIKNQDVRSGIFTKFVDQIGHIANYNQFVFDPITGEYRYHPKDTDSFIPPDKWGAYDTYPVQRVTGKKVGGEISGIFGTGILDWHANLNGLNRADGVALQAISNCEETSTSYLNMAKAYEEMPYDLKKRCKNVYCEYEYSPETWATGLPERQKQAMIKNRSKYKMWLIQENRGGKKGLHFYINNNCKIIGGDTNLYNDLRDFIFQEKYIYQHFYERGDIVLSDQILSLHKRDQNDPEILEKRVLHRITFRLSNVGNPSWLQKRNVIS